MKMELWCSGWHRNLWAVEGFGLYSVEMGAKTKSELRSGMMWCTFPQHPFIAVWRTESESHSVVSDSLWPHGILQARILEWVAFPFFRGSSQPRDRTQVSCIAGFFLYQLTYQGNQLKDRCNHLGERGWYLTIDMLRRGQPVRLTDNYDVGYKEESQTLLSGFGLRNESDEVIAWWGRWGREGCSFI